MFRETPEAYSTSPIEVAFRHIEVIHHGIKVSDIKAAKATARTPPCDSPIEFCETCWHPALADTR